MAQVSTSLSHPHLRALDDDAHRNVERVRALFDSLSEKQLTWKPNPDTWSIAECIEHLVVIDGLYIPKITDAIERAERKRARGDAPYRPALFAKVFLNMAGENGKRKVKAPSIFRPDQQGHGGDTGSAERFTAQQETLRSLMRRADGLNLNRTKFPSPVTSLLRFSIGEGLTLLISHQKRHLAQAERMRAAVRSMKLEV